MRTKKELKATVEALEAKVALQEKMLQVAEGLMASFQAHDQELHARIDELEAHGRGGHGDDGLPGVGLYL